MDKKRIIDVCTHQLLGQLEVVRSQQSDLKNSLESESKSTAGDKHDTGRAMIHLEMEKLGKQEQNLQKLLTLCRKIPNKKQDKIGLGSLVTTDKKIFFMGIPLGKIMVQNKELYCLSLASPLGKEFFGKKKNNRVEFQNNIYQIQEVL